jgi:flagellar protein FlbD
MIVLHRLAHAEERFSLNPDLIVSVEANPDTVVTLTTGTKILVCEGPDAIVEAVRTWRASVITAAMRDLPRRSAGLTLIRAAAGEENGSRP